MNINSIIIGKRHRRELGDIDGLAASIADVGLLHPVVVTPAGELIAGQRRIEACKRLGWTDIPATVVDLEDVIRGEYAENTARKDFAPTEAVAIWQAMESYQGQRNNDLCTNDTEVPRRERAAAMLGMGTATLSRAKQVVEAAQAEPVVFADLAERMDSTGNVNGAYKELKRRREELEVMRAAEDAKQTSDLYRLIEGDFRTVCLDLEPDSVDVIITDPPYPREYLGLFGDLAETAARVLKPGGSLLAMVGQSYLPDVMALILPHLAYHWMVAYLTPGGQSVQLWQRQVNTFWKPVLWFVKGEYAGGWVGDVAKSETNDNDKRYHQWGQSESGMRDLVGRFTRPGDLVLDPMMGAGTTGVAAVSMGRRFVGVDIEPDKVALATGRLAGANGGT